MYAYYLNNYGWQSDRVDKNLRQLIADHSAFDWSTLDRGSIMIYASNPNFLIKHEQSPCYFGENNSLSKLDVEGIQRTYPRQQADLALKVQGTSLQEILRSGAVTGDLRKALERQSALTGKVLAAPPK